MNYQNTYNHHIPHRALNHLSPVEALQDCKNGEESHHFLSNRFTNRRNLTQVFESNVRRLQTKIVAGWWVW